MLIVLTTILTCMNTLMTLMATTSHNTQVHTAKIMDMYMGLGTTNMGTRHLVTMPNWMTMTMICGNRNRSIASFSLLSVLLVLLSAWDTLLLSRWPV